MKLIAASALALGLLGSGAFATMDSADPIRPVPVDTTTAALDAAPSAPSRYRIWQAGRETACTVARGGALSGGMHAVTLSDGCSRLPALSGVRHWRAKANGTIALSGEEGHTVLELAEADGVAYETFAPVAPLIAMVAMN